VCGLQPLPTLNQQLHAVQTGLSSTELNQGTFADVETTAANDSEPEVQHGSTNALPLTKRTGTVDQKCQQCLQVVGVGQCWLEKLSECNGADTRSAYCSLQMLEHCCMKQKLNSDSCKCSP